MIKFSLHKYKFLFLFLIIGLAGFSFWVFAQTSFFDSEPASRYAPNFHFDSEEEYYPADPLDFYYDKDLNEIPGPIAKEKYDKLPLNEKKKQFKIFYQIKSQGNEWVYEYLLFYVFNDFGNEHYADWEPVFVFVSKNTKKINRVIGSAHNGTKTKIILANNELAKPKLNHTTFLIEKGSHASWPDGNNDGLVNRFKDLTNWYNAYGNFSWSSEDKNNGFKINYDDSNYKLEELSVLQEKLKGKESLTKSPELGINIQKSRIFKIISIITGKKYIPLGGKPSSLASIEPIFNDPEQVRPITPELALEWGVKKTNEVIEKANGVKSWVVEKVEKTKNAVSGGASAVQNGANAVIEQIGQILNSVNPFPAAIVPAGLTPEPPSLKSPPIVKPEPKSEPEPSQSPPITPELSNEEKLVQIQEALDDIFEKVDVISQKTDQIALKYEFSTEESVEVGIKNKETKDKKVKEEEKNKKKEKTQEKPAAPKEIVLCPAANAGYSSRNKVIINEIAWMGTETSANDEWIELKNISGQKVDLAGWQILDEGRQIKAIFNNGEFIPAGGFYLLERTNDDSVPNIVADKIYTGGINNTGESLELFNENCGLEDRISASPNWISGDNNSKRTMERKGVFSWQNSNNIGGTPKRENSFGYYASNSGGGGSSASPPNSSEPAAEPEPEPEPPALALPKILISEVASGWATSGNEFIELHNPNNEPLSINKDNFRLKLVGSDNKITEKGINWISGVIPAKGYFLLVAGEIDGEDQMLAPDATYSSQLTGVSGIIIEDKNYGNVLDKVSWGKPEKLPPAEAVEGNGVVLEHGLETNQSLGRKWSTTTESSTTENYIDTDDNSADFEIQEPTPGSKNKLKIKEKPEKPKNKPPAASFTFEPENPFVGETIFFNASSSTDPDASFTDLNGGISLFLWDFGDEIGTTTITTTTQATTTHIFAASGDFTVNLWAVDNFGATSSPATATISVLPVSPVLPRIVISEIQIDSILGPGGAGDDFIELYNSASTTIDVSDFKIRKRNSSGKEVSIKVLKSGSIIPPKGYFLWVNTQYASSSNLISADATSTQAISENNSIALLNKNGDIIDAVGWGSSTDPFVETALFPQSLEGGQSLGRKWSTTTESYIDTDDNSADFEIQEPTPGSKNKLKEEDEIPTLSVVINEIAWMGTVATSADEWIELYNNTDQDIDLNGWQLRAKSGSLNIIFSASTTNIDVYNEDSFPAVIIPAYGFYLLERDADDTVQNIPADQIYGIALGEDNEEMLSDAGEELELFDADGNLIDSVGCIKNEQGSCESWFAGKNETETEIEDGEITIYKTKETMERLNSLRFGTDLSNWHDSFIRYNEGEEELSGTDSGTPKAKNSQPTVR